MLAMKKLFWRTGTDGQNQTLDTPPACWSDKHLDADHGRWLQTPRLQGRSADIQSAVSRISISQSVQTIADVGRLETTTADWKSALRGLPPATHADILIRRPLPPKGHRIPILFPSASATEKEQCVPIRFGAIEFPRNTVSKKETAAYLCSHAPEQTQEGMI